PLPSVAVVARGELRERLTRYHLVPALRGPGRLARCLGGLLTRRPLRFLRRRRCRNAARLATRGGGRRPGARRAGAPVLLPGGPPAVVAAARVPAADARAPSTFLIAMAAIPASAAFASGLLRSPACWPCASLPPPRLERRSPGCGD